MIAIESQMLVSKKNRQPRGDLLKCCSDFKDRSLNQILQWAPAGNESPREMPLQELIFLAEQMSFESSPELFCTVKGQGSSNYAGGTAKGDV